MPEQKQKKQSTAAAAPVYKDSGKRVTLPGKKRPSVVYTGARGAEYVRLNGKVVSLKAAMKVTVKAKAKKVQRGGVTLEYCAAKKSLCDEYEDETKYEQCYDEYNSLNCNESS